MNNSKVWAGYEGDKTTLTQWFSSKMPYKRKIATPTSRAKKRRVTKLKKTKKVVNKRRAASKNRKLIKGVVENVLHCKDNMGVYTKIIGGDFQSNCD